jgi:hypothetical protein
VRDIGAASAPNNAVTFVSGRSMLDLRTTIGEIGAPKRAITLSIQ